MSYLVGGGQVVVGIGLLVAWWLALTLYGKRQTDKELSGSGFAIVPSVFLLWVVGAFILLFRGLGVL